MKLWDSILSLPLFLFLHIARVLTVADGATKYRFSSEKTKDAETSSTGSDAGADLASHPHHAAKDVTLPDDSITTSFAEFSLLESAGNALLRRFDRHSFDAADAVALFPKNDAVVYQARCLQHAIPYEGGDVSSRPRFQSEEKPTLCAGVGGVTKQSGTPRLSSGYTERFNVSPTTYAVGRGSRIPVMTSRSRVSSLNSGSSNTTSNRATTGSLDSGRGSPSGSLSRLSSKPMQSPPCSTGLSSFCRPFKPPDLPVSAIRRLPTTFTSCRWRTYQKTLPQPFAVENPKNLSRSTSMDGKVFDPNIARQAQRRRKSEAFPAEKKSTEALLENRSRASSGRGSAEHSEPLFEQGTSFSTVPTRVEHRSPRLEDTRDNIGAQVSPPHTLVRFRQGSPVFVLDEAEFLLSQSIERRYQQLFDATLPEFVEMAESLRGASTGAPSLEENSMAHAVFDLLSSVDTLKISPTSDRRLPPSEYMPFQVVPESLLGAGGASLVYQMRVVDEAGEKCAVKVHYCWAAANLDEKSLNYICDKTRDTIMNVNRYMARDDAAKFRFLVPYVWGEFSSFGPVILSHNVDPQKHLLNLVTVMPLLPGSFDTVLSMKELSSAAKRATCFSFVELVARLHLQKLIHGDLKPANFFLGADGQVYLGDFDTVERQNSTRECGSMATLDFLDPGDAACHTETPEKRVPLTPARDAWSLGLCLFLVWCGAYPFGILNKKSELLAHEFVSHLRDLTPDDDGGDRTTPKLDFQSCPGGAIKDGLVLELIQRFLELDRNRRWTPVEGYKLILSAGDFVGEAVRPVFF